MEEKMKGTYFFVPNGLAKHLRQSDFKRDPRLQGYLKVTVNTI